MSDWREEQRRRDQEQREKDRDREENRRHRERMALEEKRDRIASMRARGATEDEIKKSEFKRGCFPLIALILVGLGYLIFVNVRSPSTAAPPTVQEQTGETDSDPVDVAEPLVNSEVTTANNSPAPETSPVATEPSPAAAGEIKFVSEPVVQPLPSPSGEAEKGDKVEGE